MCYVFISTGLEIMFSVYFSFFPPALLGELLTLTLTVS